MGSIAAVRVETAPAALPAAGEAAGHAVLVTTVALVAFGRVGGYLGELDGHDLRVGWLLWRMQFWPRKKRSKLALSPSLLLRLAVQVLLLQRLNVGLELEGWGGRSHGHGTGSLQRTRLVVGQRVRCRAVGSPCVGICLLSLGALVVGRLSKRGVEAGHCNMPYFYIQEI
jgi:hypothetical protein